MSGWKLAHKYIPGLIAIKPKRRRAGDPAAHG
jgi:hypothetical protein